VLAAEGVMLRAYATHVRGAEALFAPDDVPDLPRVEAALRARCGGCELDETGGVTAVGAGTGSSALLVARAFDAAAAARVSVERMEAAPMRITALCAPSDVDALTRAWHDAIVV
jgi:aspartokinase